jgi:hypothetical protein
MESKNALEPRFLQRSFRSYEVIGMAGIGDQFETESVIGLKRNQ